jgi:hypothetical protein
MPGWVKALLDEWLQTANLNAGQLFRRVNKNGNAWGDRLTEKAVWHVVREHPQSRDREVIRIRQPGACYSSSATFLSGNIDRTRPGG